MRKVNPTQVIAILILVFIFGGMVFAGQVITVDDDGPADYSRIQDAIDAAGDGDTILVADGIYTGDGNRDIDFGGKAVTVKSENGPENCIIDCNGTEDDPHRGFYFHNDEDANSILDGFTITNGYATSTGFFGHILPGSSVVPNQPRGGAILCINASPTITNCNIIGNIASAPQGNQGRYYQLGLSRYCAGGGISCFDSGAIINNCIIAENKAVNPAERLGPSNGGGIYCRGSKGLTVTNCIITGNQATAPIAPVIATGNPLDMAIDGEGYFVLDDGERNVFTRRGGFAVNAYSMLVDPATGWGVQRIGSAGESDGFQTAGNSNIRIRYDIALPPNPTSTIVVQGNLSADQTLPVSQTQSLISNIMYTFNGYSAIASAKIVDLDQFSGTVSGGRIYVAGIRPDGTEVTDSTGLIVSGTTTLEDLLAHIENKFGVVNVTASLVNGQIRITDYSPGYSRTDILLLYAPGGSETFVTPAYFKMSTVGGDEVKNVNIAIYDSIGGAHLLQAAFVRTDTPNTWDMVLTLIGGSVPLPLSSSQIITQKDEDMSLPVPLPKRLPLQIDPNRIIPWPPITIDPNRLIIKPWPPFTIDPNLIIIKPWPPITIDPNLIIHPIPIPVYFGPANVHEITFDGRRIEGIEFNNLDGSYVGLNGEIGDTAEFVITFKHDTSNPQVITIDMGAPGQFDGLTEFAGVSTAIANQQDGYEPGRLSRVSVNGEGMLVGSFSNGMERDIARIQLALFNDPNALDPIDHGYFIPTAASGGPFATAPGDNGAGGILGGYFENVDDNGYAPQTPVVYTKRSLDAAIDGDGYFVLNDGLQNLFTRIGSFDSDVYSTLIDPATGYKVQRIGSVGETDGFQIPGDSNIYISYDMLVPAKPTSEIVVRGNLSAAGMLATTQTQKLVSNLQFTTTGGTAAVAADEISDFEQYTANGGTPTGTITVSGFNHDGAALMDGAGSLSLTITATTDLEALVAHINTVLSDPANDNADGSVAVASLVDGRIVVTDGSSGYSRSDIKLAYTAAGNETLTMPGYFEVATVGGEEVKNISITVYDSLGGKHTLSAAFVRTTTDNTWDVVMTSISGDISAIDISGLSDRRIRDIEFNATDGFYTGINSTTGDTAQFEITFAHDTANPQTISIDMGTSGQLNGLTQFAGNSTAVAREQDGYESGQLSSVSVNRDGSIRGSFSNGIRRNLATIQLALFQNPEHLEELDNGYLLPTAQSGEAIITRSGENGAGAVIGGRLEDPNADRYFMQRWLVSTGRPFDMAIEGERYYFILHDGNQEIFTRIGSFDLDADGMLAEPIRGYKVQRIGSVGEENGYQIPGDNNIYISYDMLIPARPASKIEVQGNLSATDSYGEKNINITIYDSQGGHHVFYATFIRTGVPNTWDLVIKSVTGEIAPSAERRIEGITFSGLDGSYSGLNSGDPTFDVRFPFDPGAIQTISFSFGTPGQLNGLTQFAGNSNAMARNQDGYAGGTLSSVSINNEGTLVGCFSNGIRSNIAQIKIATFPAPWALETIDHGYFVPTAASGEAIVTQAISGYRWLVYGGTLFYPTVNVHRKGNSFGGGIYCTAPAIIKNCLIAGNSSDNGGGVYCQTDTVFENCTISGNSAVNTGGGIYCSIITGPKEPYNLPLPLPAPEDTVITNSILSENIAEQGPQLALESIGIWLTPTGIGEPDSQFEPTFPNLRISYSNIQGGEQAALIKYDNGLILDQGNIDEYPCFVNVASGDYRLLWDSPCIDAGDPNYIPEVNETDLGGNPRVIGGRIDMGAYESDHMEVPLWISPKTIHRHNQQMKKIMAWFRLPKGVTKDQINSNKLLVLYAEDEPNGIEAIKQSVIQHGRPRNRRTSIIAFFDKAELMSTVHDNGKVKLEVVGNLTSGESFYGTDTIRIKSRRWRRR